VRFSLGGEEPTTSEVLEEDLDEAAETDKEETRGARQQFDVTYVRQGKTNKWHARTSWDRLYHRMRARGAVAYTTRMSDGETRGDENHAIVSVFLEPEAKIGDRNVRVAPNLSEAMIAEARKLADRKVKTRHPNAVIEHVEGDEIIVG
jgi:hypothetical protein